jgi:hypothetical protein
MPTPATFPLQVVPCGAGSRPVDHCHCAQVLPARTRTSPHACSRPDACSCRSIACACVLKRRRRNHRCNVRGVLKPTSKNPKPNTIHTGARSGEAWDKAEALRAVLLGLIVQAAANVNNTYWDFVNGVDTATVSLLCATLSIINLFQFHTVHVLLSPRRSCSVWCLCWFLLSTWPGFRAVAPARAHVYRAAMLTYASVFFIIIITSLKLLVDYFCFLCRWAEALIHPSSCRIKR